MVAVGHVAVSPQFNRPAHKFGHPACDFPLELHQGEDVHEGGLIGVVGTKAHVHVEKGICHAPRFYNPAPDALHAGGVIAVVVLPHLPGDGLRAARVGGLRELLAQGLDLVEGGKVGTW